MSPLKTTNTLYSMSATNDLFFFSKPPTHRGFQNRFKRNDKAVMIASDVAARGLDIPLVEHVVHYQLPRSGEIYVHRSGRTARARREGVSLMLCGADEMLTYKKLCQTLKKCEYAV